MSHDDKRAISADIPDEAIAEALAAVEECGRPEPAASGPRTERAPDGDVLPELRAALAASEELARETRRKLDDEHEARLRAAADLENHRKRAARERDELVRFANERLVKEILPVLDCLDRALAAAPPDHSLTTGVEMTRRMLEDALSRFGVKGFSAKGQRFDPRLHEALTTVATGAHPPGVVIEEQQRGFLMHDRLIRPAAVVVSAPEEERGDPAGPEDCP